MLKKYFHTVIATVAVLMIIIITLLVLPWERFKKPIDPLSNLNSEVEYSSGMLLAGLSEAPYKEGDIAFYSEQAGYYRYKAYGKDGTAETVTAGFDASSWQEVPSDGVISGTDGRKIALVKTDKNAAVEEYAFFDYVPGIIYGYSNPDQYDDPVFYNVEDPTLEDDRAVRLASMLFKSSKTSYYGSEYGSIIQGFLTKYSYMGGMLEGYYHTGTDFTIYEEQPFYSPVDGRITYATGKDDYNMIVIYLEAQDISIIILHANNIKNATKLYQNGGTVKKGDLLGFGGGKGDVAGDTHIHIEVRHGNVERFKSFSKDIKYTRMSNYDPLILADMFSLTVPEADGFEPFSKVNASGFDAQNGAICTVVGNWLYYIDKTDGNAIYKSRIDGSNAQKIVSTPCANINFYDGWLYYSDLLQAGHLTKTKADGSETVKLASVDTTSYVLVLDDWVYFANTLDKDAIFRVRHDGTEREQVLRRDISHIFYYENAFYYTQNARINSERVFKLDLETKEITSLLTSRVDRPFVYENQLHYRRYYSDKNCLAVSLKTLDETTAQVVIPDAYTAVQPGTRYMLYTNETDGGSIYIKFNDKEEPMKVTSDLLCQNLTLEGGWLYYNTPAEDGNFLTRINVYSMKKQRFDRVTATWNDVYFDCEEGLKEVILASRTKTEYPTPTPVITPEVTETPPNTALPETTTPPDNTEVPENTTPPDNTEAPDNTTPPDNTEAPDGTPEVTTTPEGTTPPEVTTTPEGTTPPEVTTTPEGTTPPEVTTTPEGTTPPEVTTTPEETTTPEGTSVPDAA